MEREIWYYLSMYDVMPEWQIHIWKSSQTLSHVTTEPQSHGSETRHFHHQDQCVQWQKTKDMSGSQFDGSSFFWCAEWWGWRMQCNTPHSHHRHCFVLL